MSKQRQIILMHQTTEVARTLEGTISGEWEIKEVFLLPTGLQLASPKKAADEARVKIDKKFGVSGDVLPFKTRTEFDAYNDALVKTQLHAAGAVRDANTQSVQNWLAYRVLPLSRANAKKLHQIMGLSQAQTATEKARIAMGISGLSISDNYWITYTGVNKTWAEVDIRQHSLSHSLAVLALTGNSLTLQADELRDPLSASAELTVHGAYPKGIFRESDGLYMYKSGSIYTIAAEIAVSKILSCSNVFGFVEYTYDGKRYGLPCSKCKLLTHSRRDLVSAIMFPGNSVGYALSNYQQQMAQMCVVDFLVANPDRHLQNWGFFRESPTWEITGLQWLYDHNNAFDINELRGANQARSVLDYDIRCVNPAGLLGAARRMYKYSGFKFVKPIPKTAFKYFGAETGDIIQAFKQRCSVLGIEVQVK